MHLTQPVTEIIKRRYSCRRYLEAPIKAEDRQRLSEVIASSTVGPLGTPVRFELIAATEQERQALRGLGTYGFIRNPTGFIAGAVGPGDTNLEDFGVLMEQIVLVATDLGLGTCWLGGSFTRSSFSRRIGVKGRETIPAVVSTGYIADREGSPDPIRQFAKGDRRLPWEALFFDARWGVPLSREAAGVYAEPLEMVRLGPSASNKQPWRIVKEGSRWHLYLQRTPGYPPRLSAVINLADVQRLDMGIAMCHLALTAAELGLAGQWQVSDPGLDTPGDLIEYTATWVG